MNKYFALLLFTTLVVWFMNADVKDGSVKYTFTYHSTTAKNVSAAGSFNNWTADANRMIYDGKGVWNLEVELLPNYYQYKFVVDGIWISDPKNDWKISDGGEGYNSIVKVGNPSTPQRKKSPYSFPKEQLPEPVLETQPEYIELYYAAWQMAWNKIQHGTKENGFELSYMDEGFNELIYQWDICFITSFAIYGRNVFPVMPSLDNFYKKQRPDGYIQRVYWETTGKPAHEPTTNEPMINPPLFAWIEWRYYKISGDSSRFKRVVPVLVNYFEWIENNCRTEKSKGLFYSTGLGSGMDNIPRNNVGTAAFIDQSAQQALAAFYIAKLAQVVGDDKSRDLYLKKYSEIKTTINDILWDPKTNFYYDLTEDDTLSATMHIGAFWTLLSEVVPDDKLPFMVSHLTNPNEFRRPHSVPALAANQPEYKKRGRYWLGGVWAPTNYMVIKGLMTNTYYALADSIAFNHLKNVSDIFFQFKPDNDNIAFEERYADAYHTLWESYSPDTNEPGTRWDNTFYSRQDFVGWTGLAPIALLIENVLGLDVVGKDTLVKWTIKRRDEHGIKNIRLGNQKISLVFKMNNDKATIHVKCEGPFRLLILYNGKEHTYLLTPIDSVITIF